MKGEVPLRRSPGMTRSRRWLLLSCLTVAACAAPPPAPTTIVIVLSPTAYAPGAGGPQGSLGAIAVPRVARSGGCADGSREAFKDEARYPRIAGCAGAFSRPGIAPDAAPACDRAAGNDGAVASGEGCNASDLCAEGWHICRGAADVRTHSPDGCAGAMDVGIGVFFATGQSGPGCAFCATGTDMSCGPESCRTGCAQTHGTENDIFGCGNIGAAPDRGSCGPLNAFSNNLCSALGRSWECPANDHGDEHESVRVIKTDASGGGVLCCED